MSHSSDAARVVVAGHICLDVIPALDEPPVVQPGGLAVIGPSAVSTGGPVGNVGLALHRLGVPVRLVGRIGDDMFGREVLEVLRGHDPGLAEGMIVVPGETTSYSIVISPPGMDRMFMHCPGANDTFAAADVPPGRLDGAHVLHFGYPPIMRRIYRDGGAGLSELFGRARARGLVVSLDMCRPDPRGGEGAATDWAAFLERVLPAVDVFAPSLGELRAMLRLPQGATDLGSLRDLAGRMLAMGAAICVLKLGDQGLYVRTQPQDAILAHACGRLGLDPEAWRAREILSPCFRPRHVAGTTGSGDCTIAGLLAAMLRREDPVTATASANAVGACSVEAPDATGGVRPWNEVAARLAAGWPRLPLADALAGAAPWRRDHRGTLFT